ncbi:MAG TPA: NAD(P)/FAD-dependent oxidoreductase [Solirubrobacteraceae bacterium]|nr:NAD(P)/FAD-dependent oxidoreductase [Solirubrobacteraceae bacterium]
MAAEHNGRRTGAGRRRVVIVGGGFGGLVAARTLGGADVEVTLVDRHSHHLFQPLLYQLATGGLSPSECATPIRAAVRRAGNVNVLMGTAVGLDAGRRELLVDRDQRLPYDSLILACGAETSFFGNDRWCDHCYGLKTLADSVALRNRIYSAFEEAERAEDPAERERWLTFVVVGGGPTGVELAGELSIIARYTMKGYYRRMQPGEAKVILLDAGARPVAAFSERLSAKVDGYLRDLGVSVHSGARVSSIDEHGVSFEVDGEQRRIDTPTVVWAAGVQAAGFAGSVSSATGVEGDRAGRLPVGEDLALAGHPEISVIGDASRLAGPDGRPLPGLATVAIQQARHVARGIRRGRPGAEGAFRYFDKGALAVVGRGRAICEIRGHELWGRPAFFTYLTVHMYYLTGVGTGHRLKVLVDWINTRLGNPQDQVIDGELDSIGAPPGARA